MQGWLNSSKSNVVDFINWELYEQLCGLLDWQEKTFDKVSSYLSFNFARKWFAQGPVQIEYLIFSPYLSQCLSNV